MDIQAQAPKRVFVLKGNHEDMALRAHDDPMVMRLWMSNGASATLADYEGRYESWLEPGGKHFEWLKALPLHLEHQNVLFCHAGLGKARKGRLTEEGLLWDRPPLDKGSYRAVVCAHTPTQSGHVEQDKGVWRCDLGLGHGMEQGLEALVLSVGPDSLSGRIVKV